MRVRVSVRAGVRVRVSVSVRVRVKVIVQPGLRRSELEPGAYVRVRGNSEG